MIGNIPIDTAHKPHSVANARHKFDYSVLSWLHYAIVNDVIDYRAIVVQRSQ